GVAVDIVQADLTQPADLAAVETRLRADARIGVLVNNAGAALNGSFVGQGPDQIGNLIALNVTALTRLAAAVAPRFAAEGTGTIVNIGSVVGSTGNPGQGNYAAAKAGLVGMTKALAAEVASRGI
ncbi:SDR family NAD(P)-dependent oxidoreductase, partial [Acinetobacter baumannii]|nr:SDR family NAD(P)-dependent oxidoreductase [Acinetobacter baumannii]